MELAWLGGWGQGGLGRGQGVILHSKQIVCTMWEQAVGPNAPLNKVGS